MRERAYVLRLSKTQMFGQGVTEGGSVSECCVRESLKGGGMWASLDKGYGR